MVRLLRNAVVLAASLAAADLAAAAANTNDPAAVVTAWADAQPAGAVTAALVTTQGTRFFFAGKLAATNPVPPDADVFFEIGSITKGFTGILMADQILAGRLAETDTLAGVLEDWPARSNAPAGALSLLRLATHTSGLPRLPGNMGATWMLRHGDDPYASYNVKLLYEWLDKAKPKPNPDGVAEYLYSNAGFAILGHALVRGGTNYPELLDERILRPLGLTNTLFRLGARAGARKAPGHQGNAPAPTWGFLVFASAGGLRSTTTDMARFLETMIGVRPNPLAEATALATRQHASRGGRHGMGYGWHLNARPPGTLIWHNGGTGGYRTFLGWYPRCQAGVVVLAGCTAEVDPLALELLDGCVTGRFGHLANQ